MARVVKAKKGQNARIRLYADNQPSLNAHEIVLVPGGPRNAYLWIGPFVGRASCTVSGEVALRKLAQAILKEVGTGIPRRASDEDQRSPRHHEEACGRSR